MVHMNIAYMVFQFYFLAMSGIHDHQTQSCRIKTYGLEQVFIQHRFLFQDVNCIEKSGTNANSGAKDEAIVFTMRRGGKTFIFGQVVFCIGA